jgi:hypothetical protein
VLERIRSIEEVAALLDRSVSFGGAVMANGEVLESYGICDESQKPIGRPEE